MFLSHWFEISGIDKVVAPIDAKKSPTSENDDNGAVDGNNTTAAMNEDPENPLWSIVAPRQKPSLIDSNAAKEEHQMVTKVPPAEMFQQQKLNATQCMHCHKLTPISPEVSPHQEDEQGGEDGVPRNDNEQQKQRRLLQETLEEKEQLQASYEDASRTLKEVTKEKRELEERMEKMRLELEVMKMKIGSEGDGGGGGSTALRRGEKETPTVASSTPTINREVASHQQPMNGAIDEAEYVQIQVLAAARSTADTISAPSFIWEKRKNLFARCSAAPKKAQKKQNGAGDGIDVQRSANLKKIIKELKKDPNFVNIRSANMAPLPDGYTLLHAAVYAGNVEVVEYLIQEYVIVHPNHDDSDDRPIIDLNERDLQGRTALHICADLGHVEVLAVLAKAYEDLEAMLEKENEDGSDEEEVDGHLSIVMDKLDTSSMTNPSTPAQQPRKLGKPKQKSRSPKPPSSLLSPKFAGPTAPIDLSGRTPLGCAATSSAPLTKKNRAQLEKMLYMNGDKSITGDRTPPRERSGGLFTPPRCGESEKKVGVRFNDNTSGKSGRSRGDDVIVDSGLTSYLSPTPRKTAGRKATPFHNNMALSPTVKEQGITTNVAWGASEMPGMRVRMEDAILCKDPLDVPPKPLPTDENESPTSSTIVSTMGIFGVFDGHGDGGFASQFISSNLISKLQSNPKWSAAYYEMNSDSVTCNTDVAETTFVEAFHDLDDDLKNDETKPRDGGTTAIVALVSSRKILVANVGDSRCILVKKRAIAADNHQVDGQESWNMSQIEVIPMSEDHKPDLPDERARIESAGLEIHTDIIPPDEDDENGQYERIPKVKKSDREMLGVSRAFGDYDYKANEDLSSYRQAVVCTPDIVVRDRVDSDDLFLILACDGVWDVMSNDEVGLFVSRNVNAATATLATEDQPAEAKILAKVGDKLLNECLAKGSTDNMSVVIVALPASGGNATVTARALAFE